MSPTRGTAPPRGTPRWLLCRAPRARSGSCFPRQGWPDFSRKGSGTAALPASFYPEESERWAPGREGLLALGAGRSRKGWGADWGAYRRSAPAGVGQPKLCLRICQSVGMSICAPGQRGRAEPQGKRTSLTCSSRQRLESKTGAQPPGSSFWASSLRREPRLFSGAARESQARSPRHCRCLLLSRLLQVPSPSAPLARWLPGRLQARAGGRAAGKAVPWRTEGGVSSLGMGKARRGSGLGWGPTLQADPGAGHPGHAFACCHLAPLGPSASPGGDGTPGVRSCRLRTTGSFGSLVEGLQKGREHLQGEGMQGRGPIC